MADKDKGGAAPADAPKAEPSAIKMKTGDYCIHVFIISGKNFKIEGEDTLSPMIEVETCGIKNYTSAKSEVAVGSAATVNWREHLFFEPRGVHASVIELDTISIRIKNKGIFKDQLIGMYEFDMTKVYFEKDHAIQNQWIALSNPESENFSEITANLKLSISVQGPGDEQVQLNESTGPEDPNQAVMMPATIKKEYKQLKIRFITSTGLPKMDSGGFLSAGTIDAYITTKFNGRTMTTKYVTAKSDKGINIAAIEQEFWIPIQWPAATDRLVLQLWDFDTVNDEIVGSMFFSIKKLLEEGSKPGGCFYWQNLYGCHVFDSGIFGGLFKKNQFADMMNENPEVASAWKGRILMHIEATDSKHPERKVQTLESGIKEQATDKKLFKEKSYDIIAEVGMGVSLPENSKQYRIKIKIGDAYEKVTANPKESKTGYNRWSERFEQIEAKSCFQSVEAMGNVYVYLMEGDKPICYWKGKASDFTDPDPKFKWLQLKADKSVDEVDEDYKAGLIQFKMSIHDRLKNNNAAVNYKTFESWKKPPPKRLKESRKIRCFIFQCRNIPAADSDGASDSFISLWNPDNNQEVKTRVIEDSLNPIYFETLEMLYDMDTIETAPPIIMNVWDRDENLVQKDSYDYLGRCTVYLHDANTNLNDPDKDTDEKANCNRVPKPKWHPIRMGFDENMPSTGEVLCSFVVARDDFDFLTPAKYHRLADIIPMKEYSIEINVLGLRELESFGLMPIKKPFIRFRIKSMLPPEKAQAVTDVNTDPNANGPNPNINTTLTFSVQLPEEELYVPSLGCDVFDYVFAGFSQPLIGTFEIPIGVMKTQTIENQRKILEELDYIITKLKTKASMTKEDFLKHMMSHKMQRMSIQNLKNPQNLLEIDEIVEDKGRVDGYQQMKDQSAFDDENPLLLGAMSQSANRPVILSARSAEDEGQIEKLGPAVKKAYSEKVAIEQKLLQYAENAKKGKKEDPSETAIKNELKKQLILLQQKFRDEKKKAIEVQKKLEAEEFKNSDPNVGYQTVIVPKYTYNEELKVYTEDTPPPASVFKPVGYNNLEVVKQMMEGDDTEKRAGFVPTLKLPTKKEQERMLSRRSVVEAAEPDLQEERNCEAEKERLLAISNKHYRKFYNDELENDKELFSDPVFTRVEVMRGQSRGLKKSWFSIFAAQQMDESGESTDKKRVGFFKGRIQVFNEEDKAAFKEEKSKKMRQVMTLIENIYQKVYDAKFPFTLEQITGSNTVQQQFVHIMDKVNCHNERLIEFMKDETYRNIITKQLQTQTQAAIQLYVLEAFDLASRDIGSFSDPYLIVSFGEEVISDRDNYKLDDPNPKFNKIFEFKGSFPGAPPLIIDCFDYDDLFGDDLIGRTSIDLDDRFFSGDWQALDEKPIEYRQLYHQSTSLSQGVVTCWCEIEPQSKGKKAKEQKKWNIDAEPVLDYEVRVAVMDTKNIPCEDVEGTSDVFIKAYIDDKDKKTTDTHYRCQTGEASFNWRLLFDLKAPTQSDKYEIVLQAWDFDVFKSNDYICEWVFDLTELIKNVRLTQQPIVLNKKYYDLMLKQHMPEGQKLEFTDDGSFWLTTMGGEDNKEEIKLRLDIRVFPKKNAEALKVGTGQDAPNMEPHLPPPIGRISFSLNPFTMLAQLVSKEYLNKLYAIICVLICCACLVAMAPMILSNFASTIMMKIIGLK